MSLSTQKMSQSVSSIRTASETLPSDTNKGLDKVGEELTQFPEGGTAAWCTIIGG